MQIHTIKTILSARVYLSDLKAQHLDDFQYIYKYKHTTHIVKMISIVLIL